MMRFWIVLMVLGAILAGCAATSAPSSSCEGAESGVVGTGISNGAEICIVDPTATIPDSGL